MKHISILCLSLAVLLVSCNKSTGGKTESVTSKDTATLQVQYAQGFTVRKTAEYTEVNILNPWTKGKILHRYILVDKKSKVPDNIPDGLLIRTPLEHVACFSSVHCSMLSELNQTAVITGVCEPGYMSGFPFIGDGLKSGTITNLGTAANPDVEKIMSIEPEAIFASPLKEASYGQLEKIGLPVIECVDYLESTPLGRAEWIRLYALFFDKEVLADSLFQQTAQTYSELKTLVASTKERPTVITEMKYGDIWYVPGGKSYMANLLKDAGAAYYWENDTATGSLSLSLETVLDKAEHADFWLIKYYKERDLNYKDMLSECELYASFDAFKKKSIYTCNTGKTRYYEELPVHPEFILNDMVWIFHPELVHGYQPKYYQKMKE